jgi:hypothetical protein
MLTTRIIFSWPIIELKGFFQKRFKPALNVLLGEEVRDGDLQPIVAEVYRPGAFEPHSVRGGVDMLGYPIQHLYPDLFC